MLPICQAAAAPCHRCHHCLCLCIHPGGVVAVFAALLCEPMAGDLHTWLQQHPQGASPTEAALGTYMLLRGIHRLHSRGAKHK